MNENKKKVEFLIADTTAFIENVQLQNIADNVVTCQEAANEITSKRQLRRLVVLPYDLQIKDVFPENIRVVTDFAKKTGDYPSLSATDIKVIALTYQLEKEKVGTDHIRTSPLYQRTVNVITEKTPGEVVADTPGFFLPKTDNEETLKNGLDNVETFEEEGVNFVHNGEDHNEDIAVLQEKFKNLNSTDNEEIPMEDILQKCEEADDDYSEQEYDDDDDDEDSGQWITPKNVKVIKKKMQGENLEEKEVKVACMTTDFAMQNVLKQMNLNVAALDGRMIKQVRTFILRCYACFKTTSIMTKHFCPKCGNNTLKKVAVSLDENGKMQIHINARKPLTARGKKFSLPRIKGGKHPNNPILVPDQPMPHNMPSKLSRQKTDALSDDYIAGFSPFVMRDVNSKSALMCIRPGQEVKYWMRKNPNEARRRRK